MLCDDDATVPRRGPRRSDQAAAPAEGPAPGAIRRDRVSGRLRFDDGREVNIGGGVLVGRRPASTTWDGRARVLPVAYDDGRGAVSRNHFEVVVDGGDILVRDRHSRNGTVLRRPDGTEHHLPGGEPAVLRDGDLILFADRWAMLLIDGPSTV
jgi:hypothetical protein